MTSATTVSISYEALIAHLALHGWEPAGDGVMRHVASSTEAEHVWCDEWMNVHSATSTFMWKSYKWPGYRALLLIAERVGLLP